MTYYVTDKSRERAAAYKQSLLGLPHIIEGAYKRGIYEFYNGVLEIVETPHDLEQVMVDRATAIIQGHNIDKFNTRLTNAGYVVRDYYNHDQTVFEGSELCVVRLASNPYKPGSLYHKEWQRGFDTGYFRNLNNVKLAEKKRKNHGRIGKKDSR